MFETVVAELHAVMEEVRERTFQLVSHLDEAQMDDGAGADHEPARVGSRPRRRLRGSVAQPAGRRARTAARGSGRALRRVRDAPQGARRPRVPARRGTARVHGGGARACARGAGHRRRAARARDPPRAPAHRDDAAGDARSPASCRRSSPGPRRCPAPDWRWSRSPRARSSSASAPTGFAYDNERPRHSASTERFTIGRTPVTNATWLHFAEGGGYERREWWSDEGWAWKQQYDITHHAPAAAGDPDAPVVHVSWFEADAFARAHEARLPTEIEWEKAATWDQLDGIGRVWEWTASHFTGVPGFRRPSLPGVLRSVLRRPLPGAARRLLCHAPAGRLPAVP